MQLTKLNIKTFSYLMLMLWMVLIFYMSSQIATSSSGMSSIFVEPIKPYAPDFTEDILSTLVRKSAHIFLYFVLGILTFNVLRGYKLSTAKLIGYSILFAGLYAITDEIHQSFVPGRSSEFRDVLIDTIGASVGVALFYGIIALRVSRQKVVHDGQQED